MKNSILSLVFIAILITMFGCSDKSHDNSPAITKEYLKQNAKSGLTETEITDLFGEPTLNEYGDGSFVWIYDEAMNNFTYKPDIQKVEFDEIKKGNIKYQLYINVVDKKAIMFSYFYRGDNNEVWNYEITANGSNDRQAS
ncbi:PhoU family transcriptional regulator [Paenibacillus sp. PR3]|uniref:PhoU family transcriptional regulator n=1 Tax=Paenibacillus terricola TaxID=2763503 RepID=A0ABR8MTI7_9BACL|nr:PhoU family transcriptional regulator [Paenibacillus terricola]MBD3918601.1 PhoU family transcriptional regulator [Paenibacillus terricola]